MSILCVTLYTEHGLELAEMSFSTLFPFSPPSFDRDALLEMTHSK
jgi:hypothetical protein